MGPENVGQQFGYPLSSEHYYSGMLRSTSTDRLWGFPKNMHDTGEKLITAQVPVSTLLRYREYDRNIRPGDVQNVEQIMKWMQEKSPMHDPLRIYYSHPSKWGHLAEGNHRLAAAVRLGITHLPVIVHYNKYEEEERKAKGIGAPLTLLEDELPKRVNYGQKPDPDGVHRPVPYFAGDMHPHVFRELR
jgi:hypothetical protein